jgi:general secretion pathway protein D
VGTTPVPVVGRAPVAAPAKRGLIQIAAPAGIGAGQQFYADIKVADVKELTGSSFVLSYDPKIVDYVSTSEGPFMKKDGKPTSFSATANAADGTVTVTLTRAPNSGGLSGSGSIVSVLFRAKSKGPASFSFQSVSFTGADGKQHEMLPFTTAVNVQ